MPVSKELTLMLPPVIFNLVKQEQKEKSASQVLLSWAELGRQEKPVDMTTMNLPSKQCVKRNVYLSILSVQTYDAEASQLGLSTSAYVLGLIVSGLNALNFIDLPTRYTKTDDIPQPKVVKSTPSIGVSEQLLAFMNENSLQMPLSGEKWTEILKFYLNALKTEATTKVDVSGYYFSSKKNQPKRKIKLPISRVFDAEIEYFARQSLSTRASIVTRAIVFWCSSRKN